MDLVGKREIHRVHEEAGDTLTLVSARLTRIIANFSWIWYKFISLSYFLYVDLIFKNCSAGRGDLSSTDRRRSADHDFKNHWANSMINPIHKATTTSDHMKGMYKP